MAGAGPGGVLRRTPALGKARAPTATALAQPWQRLHGATRGVAGPGPWGPGGGGQQFPLPSGQTTQSTGDAGLGDASNTNATAMSVMMRNRLGVGAGSHVYSSAVGMPMGGGQGQGYFPSAVVPSDDGSLQVVAEIEKILSQLRALQ